MEPSFVVSYEITLEKYLYYCNHPVAKKAKSRLRIYNIVNIIGLVLMPLCAIVGVWVKNTTLVVFCVAVLLAYLYRATLARKVLNTRTYNTMLKTLTTDAWVRTITFGSAIAQQDGNMQATYQYADMKALTEDAAFFYLWVNEDAVLRVPKDSFTHGDAAQFAAFIRRKFSVPAAVTPATAQAK